MSFLQTHPPEAEKYRNLFLDFKRITLVNNRLTLKQLFSLNSFLIKISVSGYHLFEILFRNNCNI